MKSRRGEIIKVADLFEKYKKVLKAPQSSVVKEVIEVIADITGVTVSAKYIKYAVHSRTISITAPAVVKQEIKLHQDEILIHLKARLGEQNVPKIIF
jgi:uncharacterized protein (DUF1499 family)